MSTQSEIVIDGRKWLYEDITIMERTPEGQDVRWLILTPETEENGGPVIYAGINDKKYHRHLTRVLRNITKGRRATQSFDHGDIYIDPRISDAVKHMTMSFLNLMMPCRLTTSSYDYD